jgi:hypothetical protein
MSDANAMPLTVDIVIEADDAQLLMAALGELPFKRVFELIGLLNRQANAVSPGAAVVCSLDASAFALMVEALGQLPYHRVHALIDDLKSQLHAARNVRDSVSAERVRRMPGTRMQ